MILNARTFFKNRCAVKSGEVAHSKMFRPKKATTDTNTYFRQIWESFAREIKK